MDDLDQGLTSLVHHTVSSANEFIAVFDKFLEDPRDIYQMPRETLAAIRTIMATNAMLTTKLFEENQTIMDMGEKLLKKYPPK